MPFLPRSLADLSSQKQARLLLSLLVVLSFLPSRLKVRLHTRGPLHDWVHLYLFAAIAVCLLQGAHGVRTRLGHVARLALLGFAIELLQARASPAAIEVRDLAFDLIGIAFGVVIATFQSATSPVPHPVPAPPAR